MTTLDITNLESALEASQLELVDLLHNRETIAVDVSADMLDRIQHASERDMAIGSLERGSARLGEVRGALRRIRLGTFGICLDCEEEIGMKRMAAVPWTTSCLSCREAMDRDEMLSKSAIGKPLLKAA